MHLVWIFRLAKDEEREKAAIAEAIKAYAEYYEKGDEMPEQLGEPGILYLMGELNRRLGQFREARRYYELALACKEIRSYPHIAGLTRDQILITKEQMGKA
jgi:tetratricopeptide (TPR) repeat protein